MVWELKCFEYNSVVMWFQLCWPMRGLDKNCIASTAIHMPCSKSKARTTHSTHLRSCPMHSLIEVGLEILFFFPATYKTSKQWSFEYNRVRLRANLDIFIGNLGFPDQNKNESLDKTDYRSLGSDFQLEVHCAIEWPFPPAAVATACLWTWPQTAPEMFFFCAGGQATYRHFVILTESASGVELYGNWFPMSPCSATLTIYYSSTTTRFWPWGWKPPCGQSSSTVLYLKLILGPNKIRTLDPDHGPGSRG